MRRVVIGVVATTILMLTACRNDPVAQPSPAPTVGPAGRVPAGVLPPVDRARDGVNQLNDLQERTERQTGGSAYTP